MKLQVNLMLNWEDNANLSSFFVIIKIGDTMEAIDWDRDDLTYNVILEGFLGEIKEEKYS